MGPFFISKGIIMTIGVISTQGTELFMIETASASDPAVTKFVCPTGLTGLGGPKDQIEITCLDTTEDKEFGAGLGNPSPVTVPFNFIPRDASHQVVLQTLSQAGTTLNWIVCFSEGTDDPTMDTDLAFVAPAGRTSCKFSGFISDVNIDVSTNEFVRGTMTIQRSGARTWSFYTPS